MGYQLGKRSTSGAWLARGWLEDDDFMPGPSCLSVLGSYDLMLVLCNDSLCVEVDFLQHLYRISGFLA